MKRTEILDGAKMATSGDRYGSPEDNFGMIACFWENYLNAKYDPQECRISITAQDVALMMIDLKKARIISGHGGLDSWVDICGYGCCGGEIATEGKDENETENEPFKIEQIAKKVLYKLYEANLMEIINGEESAE